MYVHTVISCRMLVADLRLNYHLVGRYFTIIIIILLHLVHCILLFPILYSITRPFSHSLPAHIQTHTAHQFFCYLKRKEGLIWVFFGEFYRSIVMHLTSQAIQPTKSAM